MTSAKKVPAIVPVAPGGSVEGALHELRDYLFGDGALSQHLLDAGDALDQLDEMYRERHGTEGERTAAYANARRALWQARDYLKHAGYHLESAEERLAEREGKAT